MKWLTTITTRFKAHRLNKLADHDQERASYHLQAAIHHTEAAKNYERRAMTHRLQADTLQSSLVASPSVPLADAYGSDFSHN